MDYSRRSTVMPQTLCAIQIIHSKVNWLNMYGKLIEQLLYEDEGNALDFKLKQYNFISATDEEKSELLKDIPSFTNSWRRETAYILIGVEEIKGDKNKVIGITEHLDDANLQQFVNSKTNNPIEFSYKTIQYDYKKIGLIEIPIQKRPFYLQKDFGKLRRDKVYIRRGSSTAIAPGLKPGAYLKATERYKGSRKYHYHLPSDLLYKGDLARAEEAYVFYHKYFHEESVTNRYHYFTQKIQYMGMNGQHERALDVVEAQYLNETYPLKRAYMKQSQNFLVILILYLFYGASSMAQIPEEDRELPMILLPVEGQGIETEGIFFNIKDNSVRLIFHMSAGVYQTNEKVELYSVDLEIKLKTLIEGISSFVDSIGILMGNEPLYYPEQTNVRYYSLPSDTTEIFLVNTPYDITIFYPRFAYEILSDTLDVTLHLPPFLSTKGDMLLRDMKINLRGIICRN
jgi:hypothetical protein